jgi:hypothetical protein
VEEEASLFTFLDLPERQVNPACLKGRSRGVELVCFQRRERERERVRARDHTHQASYNQCACAAYALFQNCVLYIFFVSISFLKVSFFNRECMRCIRPYVLRPHRSMSLKASYTTSLAPTSSAYVSIRQHTSAGAYELRLRRRLERICVRVGMCRYV